MNQSELTLRDFILARIAWDETRVTGHDAGRVSFDGWHTVDCGTGIGYWANDACTCRYVDRVLAECEAKRRIVGIYIDLWMSEPDEDYPSVPLGGNGPETYYEALQHLAAVYADHPDYRQEWKP